MRAVLGPNVLVSAVVANGDGVSAQLLDRWLTDRPFEHVVCPALVDELHDVLTRPKFRRWTTGDEARAFIDRLEREASRGMIRASCPVTGDTKEDSLVVVH